MQYLFELIPISFVLGILVISTITDLKTRTVFGSDRVFILFAIVGMSMFTLLNFETFLVSLFSIVISVTFVLLLWRFKVVASGDVLIALVMSVTLGMVTVPILLVSFVIMCVIGVSLNVFVNIKTLYHRDPLFEKYQEHKIKKFFAFFLFHQKQNWEKHVISVETEKGFSLTKLSYDKDFDVKNGLVQSAIPFVPFMLVGTVIYFLMILT